MNENADSNNKESPCPEKIQREHHTEDIQKWPVKQEGSESKKKKPYFSAFHMKMYHDSAGISKLIRFCTDK